MDESEGSCNMVGLHALKSWHHEQNETQHIVATSLIHHFATCSFSFHFFLYGNADLTASPSQAALVRLFATSVVNFGTRSSPCPLRLW